jgi:2-amino-4-hydroxy-6-hydroxymethyldihydropteridine diphosphokinase
VSAPRQGYLGLGSNVGDRRAQLQAAVDRLRGHGVRVLASSSVYETEPVGEVLDQRDFLNACVRIETELEPEALLDACKAVETELGRAAGGVRHGPRPIDVDVLMLDSVQYVSDRLSLPHREIGSRRFVIVPLLELDAELSVEGVGRLADALAALGDGQRVTRCGPPLEPG